MAGRTRGVCPERQRREFGRGIVDLPSLATTMSEDTTMCGIFAAMTRHGIASDRCDAALKLLEHRGPDGTGIWTSGDGQWTLGHTRLSIIGLRNGSQPMTSPDGAVHVVVNGEF
jgi:glutamine phosphoribosylpyrophosphate amidotransferase